MTILSIRVLGTASCDCAEGGSPPPPSPDVTFDVVAQDYNTTGADYIAGVGGSSYATAYALIDPYYVWWSFGGAGADPGDFVTELAGLDGIEVALGATDLTSTSVATTTRTALDAVFDTVGGSGTTIEITDAGLVGTVSFGLPEAGRDAVLQYGSRLTAPTTIGGLLNDTIVQHITSPAANHLVDAIGFYASDATGETVRLCLYSGGSSTSFVGTTLLLETPLVVSSGTGWRWAELTAEQAAQIPASTSLWFCLKGEGSASIRPTFILTSEAAGTNDFTTSANMSTIDPGSGATQVDPDPTVPFPASLSGRDINASFAVLILGGFRLRSPDEGTDAERGAIPGLSA